MGMCGERSRHGPGGPRHIFALRDLNFVLSCWPLHDQGGPQLCGMTPATESLPHDCEGQAEPKIIVDPAQARSAPLSSQLYSSFPVLFRASALVWVAASSARKSWTNPRLFKLC